MDFDVNNTDPIYRSLTRAIQNSLDRMVYRLKFNNQQSKFTLEFSMSSPVEKLDRKAVSSAKGNGTYYTDLNESESIREIKRFGERFLVISNKYNFTITKEYKVVNGFLCFKAVTEEIVKLSDFNSNIKDSKNEIIAWFAPDIPLQYGPIDVFGLPGLVLELQINNTSYIATEIIFDNPSLDINMPRGKKITEEEYNQILINAFNNLRRQ